MLPVYLPLSFRRFFFGGALPELFLLIETDIASR